MVKYAALSLASYLVLVSFSIYVGREFSIPMFQGNNIAALLLPIIVLNSNLKVYKGFSKKKVFMAFIVSGIYCAVSIVVSHVHQAKILGMLEASFVILFPFTLLCALMAAKRI
ncbi:MULTISPECIES: hypothetical protein [Vibrio]|uniref:hypothetical protein n=1 Tax=Vibrio TaxID=662 RepID=UPI0005EDAD86|nr:MULTISPECIES: hypothetical protein [Vibrio]EIT7146526.1 hypothetical protein [Vibrio vulnificus]EHZ2575517.1 hypothetical protein [Vibrio parahaemolyticus]EJG2021535.1 hypothetical protein [Vibrio parahaemolyticus]ELA7420913.1 hypothetical protein [Vibrio parahaemolyticus]EMB2743150.1 hypothetical protein [Vibrio parahaemolyticus]